MALEEAEIGDRWWEGVYMFRGGYGRGFPAVITFGRGARLTALLERLPRLAPLLVLLGLLMMAASFLA